ncbi:hypothetical protein CJU89_2730 [Yarrowia sp. B02]|nr:hypothetical protein CJU89_2730 [Yarrowia sp. B02]
MAPTTTAAALVSRTLLARKETPSCGDREKCPMPTGSQGLPIGLGVGIPIVAAIILCAFLHWRHLKKLRKEAEEDRDFDVASVLYDEEGKGFAVESSRQVDKPGKGEQPRKNWNQDFPQNDPFFDSPYILKGEGYSDNYSRSLTNLSAPYLGMPPPGSSSGLLPQPNHSGFLASLGGDRYPSSPASSVFRAPNFNSSSASLASGGADLRKPAPTYQRQEQLSRENLDEKSMVSQPPPLPPMNASRPSLSNPNSPAETHFNHNRQFSIGTVSDSDVETPSEDPFDRESNVVHSPVEKDEHTHTLAQSSFQSSHTSQDSQDSFSRVVSEQSRATTPDDDKEYFDKHPAPSVPVPEVPDDETTSPPTQFDRIKSVYKVYFDENKEKAMREAAVAQEGVSETPEGNLTLGSDKELPELPGDVTSDSFPADLTVDSSQMRNSHISQSSSNYDHPAPPATGYNAASARVPPGAPTNRHYAPVNALKIDFAPTTPDLSVVPHQHASPVGTSSPHSHWGTPPQGFGFHHGNAPPEAYLPQNSASMPRRKPPPLQLKPLQTVPTPHKLDQSDLGVTSFVPDKKRVLTPTGSAPGSPVLSHSPSLGYNPLHNPLHSTTDTEMMPSPHALRKSVSLASLDFAPPSRFGQSSSRNNSLTSQFSAGGTPIPQQRPTQVRSKMDTAMMLKPSWDMAARD